MMTKSIEDLKRYYNTPHKNAVCFHNTGCCSQIVLIRHGAPNLPKVTWARRKDALKYALDYDTAGVLPLEEMCLSLKGIKANHVFSSPTPRAFHTAQIIFKDQLRIIRDARFREFERKIFWLPDINFFLPLKFWLTFSRILWLLGLNSRGIESRVNAYIRATENAALLIKDAKRYGNTVLVAHGFHNKVVKDVLKKQGWELVLKGGRGYGAVNILAKNVDTSE